MLGVNGINFTLQLCQGMQDLRLEALQTFVKMRVVALLFYLLRNMIRLD